MRTKMNFCLIAFAAAVFAQAQQTRVWWKICELDIRYREAYDREHSYGYVSALGGWKIAEVTELARSGDACMQYIRGRIYAYDGVITNVDLSDVPRDFSQAAAWWRLAAEQGHGDAQASLATLYSYGRGVPLDQVEAVRWYTKAAGQGMPCEQLQLGEMYRDAQGVPKDYVQAYLWLSLAAVDELRSVWGREGELYCVPAASRERDKLAIAMSSSEIAEAQRRARGWKVMISPDPIRRRTYEDGAVH